jgi:hypothetical protein
MLKAWITFAIWAVAKAALVGMWSGMVSACSPATSLSSRSVSESLVGSGGTNAVAHQAVTLT